MQRPPTPKLEGTCGIPQEQVDIWGGDLMSEIQNISSVTECCQLCIKNEGCDAVTWWTEHKCGLKKWENRVNTTKNPQRISLNISRKKADVDQLCDRNTGVCK